MSAIMNQTCEILHPAKKTDRYGNDSWDWDNATVIEVDEVSIQPSSTVEILDDRQTTVSGWRFYGPPETVIYAIDRVRVGAFLWDVSGEPQPWPDPLNAGAIDHWEAQLEIIEPPIVPEV